LLVTSFRVEELAASAQVAVDTIRFYQKQGLLPPPVRDGRRVLYREEHVERLARIRDLQQKGFTLAVIRRLVDGDLDVADERLAALLAGAAEGSDEEFLTLDELRPPA